MKSNLAKIRTGRAHPSILDGIKVDYYGNESPLSQVSSIKAEDARTLILVVWEKDMVSKIEKAIINSDLKDTDSAISNFNNSLIPTIFTWGEFIPNVFNVTCFVTLLDLLASVISTVNIDVVDSATYDTINEGWPVLL